MPIIDLETQKIAEGAVDYPTKHNAVMDILESSMNALLSIYSSGYDFKGFHDASSTAYPLSPTLGDAWVISVAGTISAEDYLAGDVIIYSGSGWEKNPSWIVSTQFSSLTDGDFLRYSSSQNAFLNSSLAGLAILLGDLSNVTDAGGDGSVVIKSGANWSSVSKAAAGISETGHVHSIADIVGLQAALDVVSAILVSDETDLDTLQEIVDFIELNRSDLDSLTIASIAGLQTALDNKVDDSQLTTAAAANGVLQLGSDSEARVRSTEETANNTVTSSLDFNDGGKFITMTSNTTFTFSNLPASGVVKEYILVVDPSTYSIDFTGVDWGGRGEPDAYASERNIYVFTCGDGSTIDGRTAG